jgi:hypothetical protein
MTARKLTLHFVSAGLLGTALAFPTPLLAGGEGEPTPPPVSAAPPPAPRAYAPAPCTAGAPIGQVVSVTGSAHAGGPSPRALGCDDPVHCEEIVTGPGASLAFLSGDVLVRVGSDSRVSLDGSEGTPELFVHHGSVRTTDARAETAAPARLVAHDLSASAAGADLELTTAAGSATRLCALDGTASVDAGPSARTVGAGNCLSSEAGALTGSAASGPSVGLGDPGFCGFAVALDDHLAPGDVAAPGGGFAFPAFAPAGDIVRTPCDEPGSGCSGAPGLTGGGGAGGNPIPFDDPNPVPGCDVPGVSC